MQRGRSSSPLNSTSTFFSPTGSKQNRVSALLRPRVLASIFVGLVLTASILCIVLLTNSSDEGEWSLSEPLPDLNNYRPNGGGFPAGGPDQWKVRPDVRKLSSSNSTDGGKTHVPINSDAATDIMGVYERCHNSKQGRKLVTDDAGAICARQHVLSNGCCRSTSAIATRSCGMCRTDVQCCRSYEFCVSCCLSGLNSDDLAPDSIPGSSASLIGAPFRSSFNSFDKCLHLCRTSSRSIKHGNLYKTSILKHCYTEGEHSLPIIFNQQNAKIIIANQGESCSRACQTFKEEETIHSSTIPAITTRATSSSSEEEESEEIEASPALPPPFTPALFICHESFLPLINLCDEFLKKHFSCEQDRCEHSSGNDQPALAPAIPPAGSSSSSDAVVMRDGKPAGQCLINSDPKLFDCEGRHESTRRLCVCIHADKAE